jgi:hypothetical protein
MTEYKFQLVIVPEDYDYGEEEIAYRIYFQDQLISERSLPILKPNQAMVDTFYLQIPDYQDTKLLFTNCKHKKSLYKKILIDETPFNIKADRIKFKGLNFKIENL